MSETLPAGTNRPEPGDPFLMTGERLWSYGELNALATAWQAWIQERVPACAKADLTGPSIRPDPLLLLRSRNREALILHLACAWITRIPVLPLDPAMPASRLQALTAKLPWGGALVDEPETARALGLTPENRSLAAIGEIISWEVESEWPTGMLSPDHLRTEPNAWWGALLTSGSSGPPKTVPHRRRSWIHAVQCAQARTPMAPGESWLLPLPLHHAGGLNVVLRALLTGSAIRLPRSIDSAGLSEAFRNHPEIRAASMVPTQLARLLREKTVRTPSPFHGILLGGGPVRESLLKLALECDLPVMASYGMTETAGQIASRHHRPDPETAGSAASTRANQNDKVPSIPAPDPRLRDTATLRVHHPHRVRIVDENGTPLTNQGDGLLQICGPQLFEGYLEGRSILRDRFDPDGWFHTGDWGRLHPEDRTGEQFIELLSRRTDLILSGGENVLPARVETILETLPEIREAVVVGIEDPEWGERVVALVVLDSAGTNGTENEQSAAKDEDKSSAVRELVDSIRERIHDRLTAAERPKEILFVEQLPAIGPGKVDRREAIAVAKKLLQSQSG